MSLARHSLPTFADVVAASDRIRPHALHTPVMRSDAFDARTARRVFFKCENLQHGGAFKYRGALNAVLQVAAAGKVGTVVTHSSGNHGTALALAAKACGLQAHVIVPRGSSRPKVAAIERAGAHVLVCEPTFEAREAALAELAGRVEADIVHPFDDGRVIAGQGTAALELLCDEPELDVISTPVGGGGLIGGTALTVKSIARSCAVVGAEPEQADDTFRSFRSGSRQSVTAPQTIADGLRATLGALNFELLRSYVDDIVLVSEREIMAAMRIVLQDFKLLIEPSSAVPVAAALAGKLGHEGQRVGIVITGGNVDLDQCPYLRAEQTW
jgi:threonine dehydratase